MAEQEKEYGVTDAVLDRLKLNFVPTDVKERRKAICEGCDSNKLGVCT